MLLAHKVAVQMAVIVGLGARMIGTYTVTAN
jgi:hypothetical protein